MTTTAAAQSDATPLLQALFAEDWDRRLRDVPERATWLGDRRFDDRWTDYGPAAVAARKAAPAEALARLLRLDRASLSPADALSYDLFRREAELAVETAKFPAETLLLDQLDGPHLLPSQLAGAVEIRTVEDAEKLIRRWRALPAYFAQIEAQLAVGIAAGWVQPQGPLRSVPAQIRGQIAGPAESSPLLDAVRRLPESLGADVRARLLREATAAVAEAVRPALARFADFVEKTYLPAGARPIAISSVPGGADYYALQCRRYTTTNLTPREIHDVGLAEVARIRARMDEVIRRVGFKGPFAEFLAFLRTDPRFYFDRAEDYLREYRDICKRADAELPRYFVELPRNAYGVKPFPDHEAPAQTGARYYPGAADGSRAGFFMVNTYDLKSRPKYEMEALALHEAVPGHHLQIARAQELKSLPDFRRNGETTAYVEGWALYCEALGEEMGFYRDPYALFGRLTYEMWRAGRLVVDTGIHAFGWSRERAVEFLVANSAKSVLEMEVEVDRYIVWPGQALAYKMGEIEIRRLRAKAETALGGRFDLRAFHNALLDDGPLPLDLLAARIDAWIAARAAK